MVRSFAIWATVVVCLTQTSEAIAQTFKVNLSPKHVSKINEGKSAVEKLKKYRKYFSKDSVRQMKKLNKLLQKKSDSITRAMVRNEKLRELAEKKGIKVPEDTLAILNQYVSLLHSENDSTKNIGNLTKGKLQEEPFIKQYTSLLRDSTVKDSLRGEGMKLAKQKLEQQLQSQYGLNANEAKLYFAGDTSARKKVKAKGLLLAKQKSLEALPPGQRKQMEEFQKQYGPYSKEVKQYLHFLKDSVKTMDTLKHLAEARTKALAKETMTAQLGGETKQINEYAKKVEEIKKSQTDYKKQVDEYSDPDKFEGKAKKEAEEQLMNYVGAAEKKMSLLKKKYSTLLNSNDLSTGIKEKSLQGRPLRERWVIGGNFNVTSTAPLMIDLAPMFGYRLDKRWQVGVSAIYRAKFVDSGKLSNTISPERYGFSVFSSYSLVLNFFGYAEWEQTMSMVKTGTDKTVSQWVPSLLVGVGKKFSVHRKVNATVMMLWNPLHVNATSPYSDAFVIKTGFQLSELALVKK